MVKCRFLFGITALTVALYLPSAASAAADTTLQDRVAERRAARVEHTPSAPTRQQVLRRRTTQQSVQSTALERRRDRLRDAVIAATNQERTKQGLPLLQKNSLLQHSAQLHAEDMRIREYFAHESPEGVQSGDRIMAGGYAKDVVDDCNCAFYRVDVGENLAVGQRSVEQVIRDWMNSESHREAILHPRFQEIGIGISGTYWVQHFGGIEVERR